MRDPTLCLKDILRTMEAIESFVANMDFDAFNRIPPLKGEYVMISSGRGWQE